MIKPWQTGKSLEEQEGMPWNLGFIPREKIRLLKKYQQQDGNCNHNSLLRKGTFNVVFLFFCLFVLSLKKQGRLGGAVG